MLSLTIQTKRNLLNKNVQLIWWLGSSNLSIKKLIVMLGKYLGKSATFLRTTLYTCAVFLLLVLNSKYNALQYSLSVFSVCSSSSEIQCTQTHSFRLSNLSWYTKNQSSYSIKNICSITRNYIDIVHRTMFARLWTCDQNK